MQIKPNSITLLQKNVCLCFSIFFTLIHFLNHFLVIVFCIFANATLFLVYCFWSFIDDTFHLNNANSNKYHLWTWYCFIKIYLSISFHIRSSSSIQTHTHHRHSVSVYKYTETNLMKISHTYSWIQTKKTKMLYIRKFFDCMPTNWTHKRKIAFSYAVHR